MPSILRGDDFTPGIWITALSVLNHDPKDQGGFDYPFNANRRAQMHNMIGAPIFVLHVHLPFLIICNAEGRRFDLDTRDYQLVWIDEAYVRALHGSGAIEKVHTILTGELKIPLPAAHGQPEDEQSPITASETDKKPAPAQSDGSCESCKCSVPFQTLSLGDCCDVCGTKLIQRSQRPGEWGWYCRKCDREVQSFSLGTCPDDNAGNEKEKQNGTSWQIQIGDATPAKTPRKRKRK